MHGGSGGRYRPRTFATPFRPGNVTLLSLAQSEGEIRGRGMLPQTAGETPAPHQKALLLRHE
jgi:hypothetical protein